MDRDPTSSLEQGRFAFQTVHQFISDPAERVILLRHDVDARKEHSLQFARIQHEREISGTYYFRLVPESFDKGVIREIAEVRTACMHGSPLSRFDNRDLWKHFDYREYGIVAEPYFDLDFSSVLYITDTGRRWDPSLCSG